ncbi:MAG: phage baseplate assembly protein V [Planctomycetes bacterium]|nr:phage baseplate assembly protein V [Planctomycetota bacterium]
MLTATLALPARGPLPVLRIDGEEALGEGFAYDVDIALPQGGTLASASTVGAAALLTLRQGDVITGTSTWLSAVVTACTALGEAALAGGTVSALWRLRLEPALARWDQDRANAIAADADPVAAVTAALDASGVAYSAAFVAAADHARRQHLVRWQESTAAFATRLCEEEGIHSFYVHQGPDADTETSAKAPALGRHVLVLAERNLNTGSDGTRSRGLSNPAATVSASTPYQRLWSWQAATSEAVDAVAVADRDAARFGAGKDQPSDRLGANLDLARAGAGLGPVPAAGKRIDRLAPAGTGGVGDGLDAIGGGATPLAVGTLAATRRAERALCRARRLHGVGDHLGLGAGTVLAFAADPGERFLVVRRRLRLLPDLTVADAPAGAPAGEQRLARLARWQVDSWRGGERVPALAAVPALVAATGATWDGSALWVEVAVEAVPVALAFRPALRHPAPLLAGLHLATVASADATAGAGAVRSDRLGRVRVQFDWAPAGQLSGWMRVAQGARALVSVPRIGERVAVAFAYGDPGRPLVAGLVHDAASDLPGDPADGEVGRTVLGGRFAATTGHYVLKAGDPATMPRLGRADDLAAANESGTGYLADKAKVKAASARGAYLAFEDQLDGNRGIDVFSAGTMREQVGGDRTIRVGNKLTVEAGGAIEFKVGDMSLKLTRTGVNIAYTAKHVPVRSAIKLTPYQVTVDAPVVAITGTLRAEMASASSSVKAHLTTVSIDAVDVVSSSGLANLAGIASTLLEYGLGETIGAISDPDSADESPTSAEAAKYADMVYFASKEALAVVKDVTSIVLTAKALGMTPLDVMGTGKCESILGAAFIHAAAFDPEGAVNATSKFAKDVGKDVATDFAKKAAKEVASFSVAAIAGKGSGKDRLDKNQNADARAWTGRGFDYAFNIADWVTALGKVGVARAAVAALSNRVGVNGVTGVKIYGLKSDQVLLSKETAELKAQEMQGIKDDMALKADKSALQATDQALQTTTQAVKATAQAVQDEAQALRSTLQALDEQSQGLSAAETSLSMRSEALANKMGAAVNMLGP